MKDIDNKVDFDTGDDGQLPASEYNDHKNEIQGAVEDSGQTLNVSITDQFSQALYINGTAAASVSVGGTADAITLTPEKGTPPTTFQLLDGAVLRFFTTTPNTVTGVTVNFNSLGSKDLKNPDGSDLVVDQINGECILRWDNSNDEFRLIYTQGNLKLDTITISGVTLTSITWLVATAQSEVFAQLLAITGSQSQERGAIGYHGSSNITAVELGGLGAYRLAQNDSSSAKDVGNTGTTMGEDGKLVIISN